MASVTDTEARDRIAKLYTEHRELAADYWGPDKTNGKRSVIVELCTRVDTIESLIERRDQTRPQACLGLKAINEYIATVKEGNVLIGLEKEKGKYLMNVQWVQLIGIVIVALIALLK